MESLFPLVRHLSSRVTPLLLRLPVSANQVTTASLVAGIAGCILLADPEASSQVAGALLLVLCYVLDNCDGEVAVAKRQCSDFGARFDTFTDWVVNSAVFVALGIATERETGEVFWYWLGMAAGFGGTVNYALSLWHDRQGGNEPTVPEDTATGPDDVPAWRQALVHVFRELFRADFCFILLALALLDAAWLLLPAGAIGAQVYWILQFSRAARGRHV